MSRPKPRHLHPEYGSQFSDAAVVEAYRHRPAYPESIGPVLARLVASPTPRVLEIGCGSGDLTLRLLSFAARIDAVEPSEGMRHALTARIGDGDGKVRLIAGDAETAPLDPSYDLVVAGESLHWTEWDVTLPRIAEVLAPGAPLAIVGRSQLPLACEEGVRTLIGRYSTNQHYERYDLVEELASRGLFRETGRASTPSETCVQSVPEVVESLHSRNGFSRDRMRVEDAAALDTALAALLEESYPDGRVPIQVSAVALWGTPAPR